MKIRILLFFATLITGCSYSVYTSSYPHLDTIKIALFQNETTEYQLADKVLEELSLKFKNDGRLELADLNPDCLLEGSILDYSNKIKEYGDETIENYEVRILFKIVFSDLKKNEIIWQNNSLVLAESYSMIDENSEYNSEEEAQNKIISDLFNEIISKSLEEW